MAKSSRSRKDLIATGMLLVGSLIALVILSYDPTDPPSQTVFPPRTEVTNMLGSPGAHLADSLVQTLGLAVYALLACWFGFAMMLYLRLVWWQWLLRCTGLLLLLGTSAATAEYLGPRHLGAVTGPLSGSGGVVGSWLTWQLAQALPLFLQGAVLVAACLAVGWLLVPRVMTTLSQVSYQLTVGTVSKLGAGLESFTHRAKPAESVNPTESTPAVVAAVVPAPTVAAVASTLPLEAPVGPRTTIEKKGRRKSAAVAPPAVSASPPTLPPMQSPATLPMPEVASAKELVQKTVAHIKLADLPEPPAVANDGTIPIRHHTQIPQSGSAVEIDLSKPLPLPARQIPICRSELTEEMDRFADFELPSLALLEDPVEMTFDAHDLQLRERAVLLEKTFTDFGLNVRVVGINTGPVITQYEVALETGLRVHKVTAMADDIALNLKVPSVRMVAPIPGKNTVGVEVPNENRAIVRLKEVLVTSAKKIAKSKVPMFIGKDNEGRPLVYDLADMPHLLIAGRTGTGKSVCMNSLILSMLMTKRPDEVKMLLIDPKQVELSDYAKIPHLLHPIVKDPDKAVAILNWACDKMDERYDLLSRARVRNIAGYNELTLNEIHNRIKPADDEEAQKIPDKMPYIVIIVDELGDLMMNKKKEIESPIIRLAQKSRAAGIHLILATQKPTVDVITGLIKSNLPARICFQVASRSDSRVVLDEMGADKLLGKGDMLFLQPGTSSLVRAQGTYASDQEILRVVDFLECEPCYAQELLQLKVEGEAGKGGPLDSLRARDELYEQAVEIVVREGRGSVSLLQRSLSIGYGKAARFIDFMAEDGIVGPYNGSSAREVLLTTEQWEQMKTGTAVNG